MFESDRTKNQSWIDEDNKKAKSKHTTEENCVAEKLKKNKRTQMKWNPCQKKMQKFKNKKKKRNRWKIKNKK